MLIVKCDGKRIEWSLKEYRKKVEKTQQIQELRGRQEFEKPSVKKRQQKQRAKYRATDGNTKL
jgi:small subunit ribosomal protein S21